MQFIFFDFVANSTPSRYYSTKLYWKHISLAWCFGIVTHAMHL